MTAVLVPLLTLAAGAFLGLLSSLLVASLRQRHELNLRLVNQFMTARGEVADAISHLTAIPLQEPLSEAERVSYRNSVIRLAYKHYDFLPRPVIEGLMLLYVCLEKNTGELYSAREGRIARMKPDDRAAFVRQTTMFRNTSIFASHVFASGNDTLKRNFAIRVHARYALQSLNRFATQRELLIVSRRFKKVTGVFEEKEC